MFVTPVYDPEHKAFVVYITIVNINLSDKMHPLKKVLIAHLKVDKCKTVNSVVYIQSTTS